MLKPFFSINLIWNSAKIKNELWFLVILIWSLLIRSWFVANGKKIFQSLISLKIKTLIAFACCRKTLVLTSESSDELNLRKSDRKKESSPCMLCVLSSSLNHCALHREKTKTTKEIVVFFFFSFSFIFGQSLVTFWRCSLSHRYRAIFDRCAGYEFVYSLTLWSCWLRPSTERNKAERILSTRESQTEEISEIMSKRNRRMFFS